MFIHIVTEHFPPERGGLEAWTAEFAASIVRQGQRATVYVNGDSWAALENSSASAQAYDVMSLVKESELLCEPILHSEWPAERKALECQRARFVGLANQISARMSAHPQATHVLLSNFATGVGFLATTVAETLGIAHILRLSGTDFSRGTRTPRERATFISAVQGARHVVALNREQGRVVASMVPGKPISIIPTSIDVGRLDSGRRQDSTFKLFSDCGFSHKKATQILLKAFATVAAEYPSVQLTLCGADEAGQERYWSELRTHWSEQLGEKIRFPGYISREQVHTELGASDLYCSATLAEGSSAARAAAMCLGVPILTTPTGEIIDVAVEASHIKLVRAGDLQAYTDGLRFCLSRLATGRLPIDYAYVESCRAFFSPAREAVRWQEVFACL